MSDIRDIVLRSIPTGKGWSVRTTKTGKLRIVTAPGWTPTVGAGQDGGWPEKAVGKGASSDYTPNQFGDRTLSPEEAYTACGPAAAVAFAKYMGRTPTLREAVDLAKTVGWDPNTGMYGPGAGRKLMDALGVQTESGIDWNRATADTRAGRPVAFSTPGHYFVATDYNPDTGKYFVGNSGRAYKAGSEWMDRSGMESLGGQIQEMLFVSGQPTAGAPPEAAPLPPTQDGWAMPKEITPGIQEAIEGLRRYSSSQPGPVYQSVALKDRDIGGAVARWTEQFGGTNANAMADLAKPESRGYLESALGMARAGEVSGWNPVGGGQDSGWNAVGTGADDSFTGWLGGQAQKARNEWAQGDWGGAGATALSLPFGAISKGTGYLGGSVMGGMAALSGQPGPIQVGGPLSSGDQTIPGAANLSEALDYAKAQQRWQAVNPLARFGIEVAATLGLPTKGMKIFDRGREAALAEQAATRTLPEVGSVGALPRGADSVIDKFAQAAGPYAQAVMGLGPVAAGAAAFALTPPDEGQETPDLMKRVERGVAWWGGTSILGWGISAIPGGVMRSYLARRPGMVPIVTEGDGAFSPELQATLGAWNRGEQIAEGFRVPGSAVPPTMFLKGNTGNATVAWAAAQAESKAIDTASFLKPWVPRLEVLASRRTGATELLPEENPLAQFRLISGNARSAEALVMEPMAKTARAYLHDKIEMNNLYEPWSLLKVAVDRAGRGVQTGKIKDLDDAVSQLDEFEKYLRDFKNPAVLSKPEDDIIFRFNQTMKGITHHSDEQLKRMRDAETLSPLEAKLIAQQHEHYTYLKDLEFTKDRMAGGSKEFEDWFGDQAKLGQTYLTRKRGIDPEHPSGNLIGTGIMDTIGNGVYRENLLNKNKMFLSLESARKLDPDGFGKFILESSEKERLPVGWERLPGFVRVMNPALVKNGSKILKLGADDPDAEAKILVALGDGTLTREALVSTMVPKEEPLKVLAKNLDVKWTSGLSTMEPKVRAAYESKLASLTDPKDIEELNRWMANSYDDTSVLGKIGDNLGVLHDQVMKEGETTAEFHRRLAAMADQNDLLYVVEKSWLKAPSEAHKSLMGLSSESLDAVSRAMSKFNQYFRAGVTSLSLPFVFRNPIRDLEDAFVLMGTNSITMGSYVSSFLDSLTGGRLADFLHLASLGKTDSLWERMARSMRVPGVDPNTPFKDLPRWVDSMLANRGGLGTLAETIRSPDIIGRTKSMLPGAFDLTNFHPGEALRHASEVMEMSTRVAVYRTKFLQETAKGTGEAVAGAKAALKARGGTIDFSRSGQALRALNAWFPLLNARVQGQYRTYEALREDPFGFLFRSSLMVGIPTIMTHFHNMENFPDTYYKIPPEVRDTYFPVIFGEYSTPTNDVRPLYFTVPKNDWYKLISSPMEWALDLISHHAANGDTTPLGPGQRSERDMAKMLKDVIANQLPLNINSNTDTFLDPVKWGQALVQAVPLVGTASQLVANQNWNRGGQPIFDPREEYSQPDDYFATPAGPFASLIAKSIGANVGTAVPSQIAFAVKGLGGTLGQMVLGGADVLVESLGLGAPQPRNYQELARYLESIPPDDPDKYAKIARAQSSMDMRPEWVKPLSMMVGSSGGQQTQAAKARQMSQKDQAIYLQTHDYQARTSEYMMTTYRKRRDQIDKDLNDGRMTHQQAISDYQELNYGLRALQDQWKKELPLAISDPAARKEFHDRMPGIPISSEFGALPTQTLPPEKMKEAVDRYQKPPALKGNPILLADPQVVETARNGELMSMARAWKVSPNDLRDQITAYTVGKRLPTVVLPAAWLEDAVAAYRAPRSGPDGEVLDRNVTDPVKIMLARNAEMARMAGDWTAKGYPISADDLKARVQVRLTSPENWSPTDSSYERAMTLASAAHDPLKFPEFATQGGRPLNDSGPQLWEAWNTRIDQAKSQYGTDSSKWPPDVKMLYDAQKYGATNRLTFLTRNADYTDYQRWFGFGKELSEADWNAYMTGQLQRYRGVRDVNEANRRDSYLKIYASLPAESPLKMSMKPLADMYRKSLDPGWRANLMKDPDLADIEQLYQEVRSIG